MGTAINEALKDVSSISSNIPQTLPGRKETTGIIVETVVDRYCFSKIRGHCKK